MTDIIKLARESELNKELWLTNECMARLERFAELVAKQEREACAQLFPQPHMEYFGREIQDAIRARAKEQTP
jgi:hypothetical protein